jgi:hypothetical protein
MRNVTNHSIHLSQDKYLTYIFKRFGMMDCKFVDTHLPIGQKLTKEMGPKDIHEVNLMNILPYVKVVCCNLLHVCT